MKQRWRLFVLLFCEPNVKEPVGQSGSSFGTSAFDFLWIIVKEPVLVGQSETAVHGLSAFDRATGPTFNDSFIKDLFNLCPKP